MNSDLKTKFDTTIQKAIENYYLYGERSNKKVAIIHSFLGELIQKELGSRFSIKCLPDKEEVVPGQYNNKYVDICIKDVDEKVMGIVSVKFIMCNYKQNSNNYFENLTGELHNLSPNYYELLKSFHDKMDIPSIEKEFIKLQAKSYARWAMLITFDDIPYFDKDHNVLRYEQMKETSRYKTLINNGLLDVYSIVKCSNGKQLNHPSQESKSSVEHFVTNNIDVDQFQKDLRVFCSLISNKQNTMEHSVKNKGVVFTGKTICDFMTKFIDIAPDRNISILEPSCGEGAFLESLIPLSNNNVKIYGNDINEEFINTCKNKFGENVLLSQTDFIKYPKDKKYDYIIGNPPYVRIQNIPSEQVQLLKKEYPEYLNGNFDLYMYFILKCIDMLTDDGKLIFIVPNTLLYNKSCSKLKQYLFDNGLVEYIIDFKDKKMFENYNTYTCIIVLNKKNRSERKSYFASNDMNNIYNTLLYCNNNQIENSLLKYIDVKNGIATLADKVFIINPKHEEDIEIEQEICKKILKVSKKTHMTIIYPYDNECKIISEDEMKTKYPKCYQYLLDNKDNLEKRDKGNKKYDAWYAYGRKQSITTYQNTRLFIPTLVSNIKDNMILADVPLFYSGLWIDIKASYKDKINTQDIQNTLMKVEESILQKSNVKSQGWFSLSKSSFDVECDIRLVD